MEIKSFHYKADKICTRCIIDDTIPGISFDEKGVCPFCKIHDELEKRYPLNEDSNIKLNKLVNRIARTGTGKKYDCLVGVSGGRDSTFTLYNTVKFGLRPLVVHFDNGWNSEVAVQNIKNACKALDVDLYTHVADWEEFKDLQRAFLKASVSDAEIPTDWVIFSVLFKVAAKEKVKYIIHGHSFRTEGTTPLTWTYMDGRYVKQIHKKFGSGKTRSFPVMGLMEYLYYTLIKQIKQERILYYIHYDEKKVMDLITKELNWKDYGGKHHESKYTAFFQGYILTRKFNIDKRKLHYSALIRSGQLTRDQALEKVQTDPYFGGKELLDYCLKKLDFTLKEFDQIMNETPKSFMEYKSFFSLVKFMKKPIKWATRLGIVPETVYMKYFNF
jgi:N-acetyl sugar amidotransferase